MKMTTKLPNSKELKLGEILRDAGLISPSQLTRALQEQKTTGSSLAEILTKKRYITAQRIVDLLTTEIPLPFGAKTPDKELWTLLLDTGIATEQELQTFIDESELGRILVEQDFIKPFQLELARQEQMKIQLPLWRTLVNLKFLSPEDMYTILKDQMYRSQHAELDELVGDVLVNTRQITRRQLREAQKQKRLSHKPLGKILIEQGMVSAINVAKVLEEHLHLPFIDLYHYDIQEDAVLLAPPHYLREHKVLPVALEKGENGQPLRLLTAVIDPLDIETRNQLSLITGCEVIPLLTTEKALMEMTDRIFLTLDQKTFQQETRSRKESAEIARVNDAGTQAAIEASTDNSAVKLFNAIVEKATRANATDIHFEPQIREELRVRYRIDGMLHDVMTIPKDTNFSVISRIKVLADMNITERRQPQDGHITMNIGETEYYMRIGTLPTKLGERLVIRLLNEHRMVTGLTQLGLEEQDFRVVKECIAVPYGMILATGPVGSGKTTTLYSALTEIDLVTKSVMTIENPVEYQLPGISQVEVDPKIGLTFAAGLRAILRQDPNTLMVGEIRDPETATVAIRAALTGQQLLSTLHTQDSVGAIATLSYLGVGPFWIASALIGVIAQRLVRKICPYCKEPYTPDPQLVRLLNLEQEEEYGQFYHGKGCDACFHSGFSGRTGIFEVLRVDESLRKLIVGKAPESALKDEAILRGMTTLKSSGVKKIVRGETTVEEVLRVVF